MKTIGLTGGIGSGKTTVARMFEVFKIPIYIADTEAKVLMEQSKVIRQELESLLGTSIYKNGRLNRGYMAEMIFNNSQLLNQVNQIVHPRVEVHFQEWKKQFNSVYCIKEVAILFENNGHLKCDKTILVVADKEERINRVMLRDNVNREKVLERISHQWPDSKKIPLSDYIIKNNNIEDTRKQVKRLHSILIDS